MRVSEYGKNVITLMVGTTIAQAIPIAISPILTRLYTPDDFGVFALYFSTSMILSVFATAKYEMAVTLPESDRCAVPVVQLSILIAIAISLMLFLLVLAIGKPLATLLGFDSSWVMYFLPFSTLIIGMNQTLYYYLNRKKKYHKMATSRVVRSVGTSALSLAIGIFKSSGFVLVVSDVVGQLMSTVAMFQKEQHLLGEDFKKSDISKSARAYANFPKFSILSGVFEKASGQAPIFLLGSFFKSTVIIGFFSLAQRTFAAPADLIVRAMGDVFRQQASEAYAIYGDCRSLFVSTFKKLFLIAIVPFSVGYLVIEDAFAIVFGDEWRAAGEYAKILLPMFFLQFLTSPLSVMFVVAQRQKLELVLQIGLLAGVIFAFFYGFSQQGSVRYCLWLFNVIYCAKYVIEFSLSYTFTRKS